MAERKTCLEKLRELEAAYEWEGERPPDHANRPVYHVEYTKKEKKQIRKENKMLKKKTKKGTKKKYYALLGVFDPDTRYDIHRKYCDDKNGGVKYMMWLLDRIYNTPEFEKMTDEEFGDEFVYRATAAQDPLVSSGNWDAWVEYTEAHPKMSMEKLRKQRKKFHKIIKHKDKKLRRKYKSFEAYDPLFRMRRIDEVELKKSLKSITRENAERRDRFLRVIREQCGLNDEYLMETFKDRTKAANKALNKFILDMNKSAAYGDNDDPPWDESESSGEDESYEIKLDVDKDALAAL